VAQEKEQSSDRIGLTESYTKAKDKNSKEKRIESLSLSLLPPHIGVKSDFL